MSRALAVALASLLLAGTSGCALTSKAEVVSIRYFSPEPVKPRLTSSGEPASPITPGMDLRLGRVSSGSNLRERIAYRDSAYELGYYDDARWTERPETFVRRELGRTLFEQHHLRRVSGGSAPTLDVEVIAFDDLRLPTGRAARVQLKMIVSDDTGVMYEETLTVDRSVLAAKPKVEDVVAAMAGALEAAAEQVATKVTTALAARRASSSLP